MVMRLATGLALADASISIDRHRSRRQIPILHRDWDQLAHPQRHLIIPLGLRIAWSDVQPFFAFANGDPLFQSETPGSIHRRRPLACRPGHAMQCLRLLLYVFSISFKIGAQCSFGNLHHIVVVLQRC
jgi:hypothetical protein